MKLLFKNELIHKGESFIWRLNMCLETREMLPYLVFLFNVKNGAGNSQKLYSNLCQWHSSKMHLQMYLPSYKSQFTT
jgi:hypothetical protein